MTLRLPAALLYAPDSDDNTYTDTIKKKECEVIQKKLNYSPSSSGKNLPDINHIYLICKIAGIELAITQEDYENMPENGKYDPNELEITEAE